MRNRRIGAVVGAALVVLVPVVATGTAEAAPKAGRVLHVYEYPGWQGIDAWLYTGEDNYCTSVGAWNDGIRSARTESSGQVELWEHIDCTGISITVDSSGYSDIGPWVSAIRSHS
jgi:hypothetical protein